MYMTSTEVDYPIKAKHLFLFLINRVKMSKFVSLSVKNGETTNAKKGGGEVMGGQSGGKSDALIFENFKKSLFSGQSVKNMCIYIHSHTHIYIF